MANDESPRQQLTDAGASPEKIDEIDAATRETLREVADNYGVAISEKSEDLVVGGLLTYSSRGGQTWVAELHESMVDPGDGARTDVSIIVGTIVGRHNRQDCPADLHQLANEMLSRKYDHRPDGTDTTTTTHE